MVGQVPPERTVRLGAGWSLRLGPAQNVAEKVRSPNSRSKGRNQMSLRGRSGEGLGRAWAGTGLGVELGVL